MDSAVFKALGDPNRLAIFDMLRDGELCACHILERLNISQPTLSHHMSVLVSSGLVNVRKSGQWNYYSISVSKLDEVAGFLGGIRTDLRRAAVVLPD